MLQCSKDSMWQCFTQPRRPNALNSVHVKALSNPYMICMKMKIVDRAEKKAVSARNGRCEDEYYAGARPGYGPYYGGSYGPGYGPGYAGRPGYGPYPGAVTVEIGDQPYYNRGPGYYVGRSYYVWRPGHWVRRHGQRVWIHGHYVLRG